MIVAASSTTHHGIVLNFHQNWALVVVLYSLFLAVWGVFLFLRGSNPSGGYLGALIIGEGVAILQGIIGLVLLLQGHRPGDNLHYLYGVVAVVTLPSAYFYSDGGTTRRDSIIFGLACLFMVGIAIRGMTTGGAS